MKIIKSITNCYKKLSNFGKILLLVGIFLIILILSKNRFKENMTTNNRFTFLEDEAVYDEFYANIYDDLVYSGLKNNYELDIIIKNSSPNESSMIADIGCGTGHHVNDLTNKNLKVIGIDISPSMIELAKHTYPKSKFKIGNALNESLFNNNSLTHILCFYFTIYYFKNKSNFFNNCMQWLMPGGYLIVHLVDRESFDPILPPGNPLYIVSPQKYAKDRITKTKVTFNNFVYQANFNLDYNNDIATFDEKFKFKDGKVRKQQQKLYMEDTSAIINIAQSCGFILQGKINMVKCAYEHQFIYIFIKPS